MINLKNVWSEKEPKSTTKNRNLTFKSDSTSSHTWKKLKAPFLLVNGNPCPSSRTHKILELFNFHWSSLISHALSLKCFNNYKNIKIWTLEWLPRKFKDISTKISTIWMTERKIYNYLGLILWINYFFILYPECFL